MKKSIRTAAITALAVLATLAALAILAAGCDDSSVNSGGESKYLNMLLDVFSKNPGHNDDNTQYTLTVNVSPTEGGTVSRNVEQSSYTAGTQITVTATPKTGYEFFGWSGASNSTSPEITIAMNGDKTLTAGFRQEGADLSAYDVYFNANGATGGAAPLPTRAVSGNSITLPAQASMEKPGYSFAGWNEDNPGTGTLYDANSSYTVTHGATLYARWLPICTVTYNTNGATSGNTPEAVTADSGTAITLPNKGNMVKEGLGYYFGGWSTSNSGVGEDYADGATYIVTGDVTLYARWNRSNLPEVGVGYDGNGNKGEPYPNLAVLYELGTEITLPGKMHLEKDGYYFDGWCTDPSCTGDAYPVGSRYTVTSGVTFYAKWVALPTYTVTFNGNGAPSGDVPTKVETYSGNSITLPTMARNGHTFGGWYENSGGIGTGYGGGSSYSVTDNVTLYAKWTVVTYTLTFNGNGATSGVPAAVSVNYGNSTTLPTMTRTGYTFMGWSEISDGTGTGCAAGSSYTVNGNVTLYAKWTVSVEYGTLSYGGQTYKTVVIGGMRWMAENLNYAISDSWCYNNSADSCVKYGRLYTWAAANTACPIGWRLPDTEDWYRLVEAAGGQGTAGIKLKNVTGWYSYRDFVNTNETGFSALPGGRRLSNSTSFGNVGSYGFWWTATEYGGSNAYHRRMDYNNFDYDVTEHSDDKSAAFSVRCVEGEPTTYKVTFDGNGAASGVPAAVSVNYGSSTTLPSMTRTGYTFGGWNTNSSGTGTNYAAGTSYTITGNVTLYAKWMAVYTVTFDGNGTMSGVPLAMNATSGSSITLPSSMTQSGYTFVGWYENSGGTATGYAAGSSYTVTGDVTLFAKWTMSAVYGTPLNYGGQTYKTVAIGGKMWMAENLNYQTTSGSWCYGEGGQVSISSFANSNLVTLTSSEIQANCNTYGRLYAWGAAKTACPTGWKLPDTADWNHLVEAAGGLSTAGKKLKATSGWGSNSSYNGTDDFGFSALPGGSRTTGGDGTSGIFSGVGDRGYWWTATQLRDSNGSASLRYIIASYDDVMGNPYGSVASSVRCVQE